MVGDGPRVSPFGVIIDGDSAHRQDAEWVIAQNETEYLWTKTLVGVEGLHFEDDGPGPSQPRPSWQGNVSLEAGHLQRA